MSRLAKRKTATDAPAACPLKIEYVPGLLADADGDLRDVVVSPSTRTVYVRSDIRPSFEDGIRLGVTYARVLAEYEGEAKP